MPLRFPRLVGILGLVWVLILRKGLLDWPNDAVWLAYVGAWLVTCGLLVAGRHVAVAGAALCLLSLGAMIDPARHLTDGLALFAWIGLILAMTEGRPHERALLLRVLVSSVYAFAAVSKLNPTFLEGHQLVGIFLSRDRWDGVLPFLEGPGGLVLSWGAIATEGWLAIGLWLPRARRATVALGLIMHPTLIAIATYGSVPDVAFLIALNMLIVVSYLAFFEPIGPPNESVDVRVSPSVG